MTANELKGIPTLVAGLIHLGSIKYRPINVNGRSLFNSPDAVIIPVMILYNVFYNDQPDALFRCIPSSHAGVGIIQIFFYCMLFKSNSVICNG